MILNSCWYSQIYIIKKTTKTTKTKALTSAKKTAKPAVKQTTAAPAAKKAKAVARLATTKVSVTTISANIDVGFGNTLYLRGDGHGLSWVKGVSLNCVTDEKWSVNVQGATKPFAFKFLLNDETWNVGEDYTIAQGKVGTFEPKF